MKEEIALRKINMICVQNKIIHNSFPGAVLKYEETLIVEDLRGCNFHVSGHSLSLRESMKEMMTR